jgi:hypothetical protein
MDELRPRCIAVVSYIATGRLDNLPALGPFFLHRLTATTTTTSPSALDWVKVRAPSRSAVPDDPTNGAKDQLEKNHPAAMLLLA